jgi:hypothetical protein
MHGVVTSGKASGLPAPTGWVAPSPYRLAEFAARRYKSHRAIPPAATFDSMMRELEVCHPQVFRRVSATISLADGVVDHEEAPLPAVVPAFAPPAAWEGVVDEQEQEDELEEKEQEVELEEPDPGHRLADGVVALAVEQHAVRGPAAVGASLEDAVVAEAQALQPANGRRALRHNPPVNYRKERLGLAGLNLGPAIY